MYEVTVVIVSTSKQIWVNDFLLRIEIFELDELERNTSPGPKLLGSRINSIDKQTTKLMHYHYDVWTFIPDS